MGNCRTERQCRAFSPDKRFPEGIQKEGGFDELTRVHLAEEKEAFDTLGFQWFFDMAD